MLQRIFSEALQNQLQQGLKPYYLLSGQDLLLVDESKDHIVQAAHQQGFEEKIEMAINNETKWELLFDQAQSNGLFSSRQIFILNLPDNFTAPQQKQLLALLQFSHSDLLFVLHTPKLTKVMEKQSWLAHIEKELLVVNCQTPDISKMPIWLQQRAKIMGIQLEPETIKLLAFSYEGNLLALKQALQMLQLRFPQQSINIAKAKEVIEQSAQFTPFQWVDALLEGKTQRAIRILHHLRNEETPPVVLLRIIQKELMLLLEITRSTQHNVDQLLFNGNLRSEFQRLKIWQNRQSFYTNAVNRLSYRKLYLLIQSLAQLEKEVKQEFSDEIWLSIERFCLQFS